jgi:hypothetical protein
MHKQNLRKRVFWGKVCVFLVKITEIVKVHINYLEQMRFFKIWFQLCNWVPVTYILVFCMVCTCPKKIITIFEAMYTYFYFHFFPDWGGSSKSWNNTSTIPQTDLYPYQSKHHSNISIINLVDSMNEYPPKYIIK